MSSLAGLISNTASEIGNAITGSESIYKTSLDDFLSKFGSSEGIYVNTLDPLQTFEILFKFYPTAEPTGGNNSILKNIATNAVGQLANAAKNAVNNVTGGLVGSILNSFQLSSVLEEKKSYIKNQGNASNFKIDKTLQEYIMFSNMLVKDTSGLDGGAFTNTISEKVPLELQMGMYVQDIVIPKITQSGEEVTHAFGKHTLPGNVVTTDNNNLTLTILNTKAPLIERIFYPWLKEVTLPYWTYKSQPYTTADIIIDFREHCDVIYKFVGCKPITINTIQPNQQAGDEITRQVILNFDCMFVKSDLEVYESWQNKLLDTVGTGFSTAATILGGSR